MTALGRVKINGTQDTEAQKSSSWMAKMQSPRVQCCLCACCVMSAMLGMFMLSAGVCLVLNYNFLEVDTSGLPPNLHNDEGKKVVGIILICVGVFALILSGVISTLYFTTCSQHQTHSSVGPDRGSHPQAADGEKKGGAQGRPSSRDGQHPGHPQFHHHHYKHLQGNGSTPGRSSPSLSGSRRAGAVPRGMPDPATRPGQAAVGKDGPGFSRSGMKTRSHASPSSSRSHRRGKKGRHGQGRYKNPLAPHPEEAGAESQSLSESRRSASSSRRLQGHVNHGAELEDDLEMTQDSVASSGSSSAGHAVIIRVDPSHDSPQPSPTRRHSRHRLEEETRFTDHHPRGAAHSEEKVSRLNLEDDDEDDDDDDEEEEEEDVSGRMSRSTMDSQDLSEGTVEEGPASKKRLDRDIQELLS